MKKVIYIFLVLATTIFANPLDFKTLKGDFTQTITNNGSKIEYKGSFIITKELALWHYESPAKKDIYVSKEKAVMIEPLLEQAIITSLKETPNLNNILDNATKKSKDLYEATYEDIIYKIELKNNLLNRISYKDNLDNSVVIDIKNLKKDLELDETNLIPMIPKDYDVVYNN
ncbi:periplasmic outer membrane-specific lipoprotein chaperone [Campylobacter blaseri]|uniref:Outer membrane lipoprotein chaperone LolA n=1 Tax=Campylobacter blaseri TaxID=2042961 RepID=A0A2P8QZM1_9BACT|nr:LolA-like outer membrane lipoprotein chaperone [Campylobacter blaseri]PSM51697.1 outer membrane lipoprotein chaperone LolA [Campylobacter blaseri]PSM53487.1 outer membrane lipoprotein chaperone LolA [Campylobacter blaseri]QKF86292.1 periplasmic outer membrane-specific lipoprotein chaperone [Campylobacter blaseri]